MSSAAAIRSAAKRSAAARFSTAIRFASATIPTTEVAFFRNFFGLLALLPLVGVWSGSGQANDNGEEYAFGQRLVVSHDGENYLRFESRTWRLDEEGNSTGADQREVGFWRISLKDEIEVTLTNSRGLVEILYGEPVNERAWQLTSASTIATETGPASHGPGKRLYGLMPNNNLGWVDERAVDGEMVPYMSAELKRIAG